MPDHETDRRLVRDHENRRARVAADDVEERGKRAREHLESRLASRRGEGERIALPPGVLLGESRLDLDPGLLLPVAVIGLLERGNWGHRERSPLDDRARRVHRARHGARVDRGDRLGGEAPPEGCCLPPPLVRQGCVRGSRIAVLRRQDRRSVPHQVNACRHGSAHDFSRVLRLSSPGRASAVQEPIFGLVEAQERSGGRGSALPLCPLINGEPSTGDGARIPDVDPSTGEPFGWVACADSREIDQAIEAAAFAAKLWRAAPFEERARRLTRLAEQVYRDAESIAGLIALEQGKPYAEAMGLEVLPALDHLQFLSRHAHQLSLGEPIEPRHPLYAHKRALYLYDPLGVVALVTASSLPFAQPLIQTASALAMGNAVVLKPSELTPLLGLRVGELCLAAGFPAGLVNVVPASREDTLRLVSHDRVDKVFATGTIE